MNLASFFFLLSVNLFLNCKWANACFKNKLVGNVVSLLSAVSQGRKQILFENNIVKSQKKAGRPEKLGWNQQRRLNSCWEASPPPPLFLMPLWPQDTNSPTNDNPVPSNQQVKSLGKEEMHGDSLPSLCIPGISKSRKLVVLFWLENRTLLVTSLPTICTEFGEKDRCLVSKQQFENKSDKTIKQ